MTPKVWVYSVCWNEVQMMPFFLRHYATFADKIIIYDEQSTDGTRELIKACPRAELREWPHRGLDDDRFIEAVNTRYKEARGKADWVIFADTDELLYHPEPLRVLSVAKEDMLPAIGYALISTTGWPTGDGQLYELVRTGIRQDNYDKSIIWRPSVDVVHTHGRHSPNKSWPNCSGVRSFNPQFKLLHCHHVGGAEDTAVKNQRNFVRANNKKFAWNYDPHHNNDPKQNGSVAWVADAVNNNKLIEIMPAPIKNTLPLRKLMFGSGGFSLAGWETYDIEIDIRKPLPFPGGCASHILAEHVVEHVSHQQAWNFFEECRRVLAPKGIVRIAIPDVVRMARCMTDEYRKAVKDGGHGDNPIRAAVFEHGHRAAWTEDLLGTILTAVGFKTVFASPRISQHEDLTDVEQHWRTVGDSINNVETSVVEGTKL